MPRSKISSPVERMDEQLVTRDDESFEQPSRFQLSPRYLKLLVYVFSIFLVIFLFVVASAIFNSKPKGMYQAVFLSNGQVYFGKLSNIKKSIVVLRDVYYLQSAKPLQSQQVSEEEERLRLVRLGGEFHGPERVMYINRDSMLFYESLRSDSAVIRAILESRASE